MRMLIDRYVVFVLSTPPLYFVFENSKNTRKELARPVMGTIFLVIIVIILYYTEKMICPNLLESIFIKCCKHHY